MRFIQPALVIAMLTAVIVSACSQNEQRAGSVDDVQRRAWAQIDAGALLVDVRSAEEFAAGHLPGAINIPHTAVAERIDEFGDNGNRSIVLYCRSGRRSGLALGVLKQRGFRNAINAGGYVPMLTARDSED